MTNSALKNLAVALLGTTMMAPAVLAQESADAQITSVYDRYREDFSPLGVRAGSFLFNPKIDVDAKYDSNIYARETGVVDDFLAIVKPSFKLSSDWNNNFLSLFGDAKIGRYADNSAEDYEDYTLGAEGRLDVTQGTSISAKVAYGEKHEDRGSPDASNDPLSTYTKYNTLDASVGVKRDEGMFSVAADMAYLKSNYDSAFIAGVEQNNDHRDREKYTGTVRLGYHLNEDYEAFVRVKALAVDYEDSRLNGGPLRDSDGWSAVGGAAFNLGGKSEGEVYLGYVKRDFDSASLNDISDVKFGASVLWAATGLTSVKVAVDRDVVETVTAVDHDRDTLTARVAASSILSTSYSVGVQHELQRNLLMKANVSYNAMAFQNIGLERKDDIYKIGAGAKYLLNRNLAVKFDYTFGKRASTSVASDYDRHSAVVSLVAQW